jgi:16S rRNA processing protein RimM
MGQRSTSRSISGDGDTLVVGQIRGPHGVRGEVRIDPRTDIPGRFAPGAILECDGVGPLKITSRRGPQSEPIVRFEGYDTREAVESLKDKFLTVTAAEARRKAGHGAFLWRDLVGLDVISPDGGAIGIVRDLIRAGGADVLVIDAGGKELLLPMIDSVIRTIDVTARRIVATPLEELG